MQSEFSNYHIYFCLDDSASMRDDWNSLVEGVKGFCDKRIQTCQKANVPPGDLVTIVNYSNNSQVMCASVPIDSQPHTKTRFRSGGTDFRVGLNCVAGEIAKVQDGYQPVLVFMSDGGSSTGDAEIKQISENYKNKGIDIFLLGFSRGCNTQKLKNMAKISGGQYFFGANRAALKEEFESISTQISKTSFK